MTPEGKLKADCRKIAKKHGLIFWNIEGKGINGVPDTLCGVTPIAGAGVCFVEFKRPDGTGVLSAQQNNRRLDLLAAGAKSYVVSSVEQYERAVGLRDVL